MSSKVFVYFIISCCFYYVHLNQNDDDISPGQAYLLDRLKSKDNINNPYLELGSSKICTGTNFGINAGTNDYNILKARYSGCEYVDGNLEITNFRPELSESENDDDYDKKYDFSFLDSIREITGCLILFNSRIKTLRLKNLKTIRGKYLHLSNYSVFIGSNDRLERLDLTNLTEIHNGSVFIGDNSQLCHMNEVIWEDIVIQHKYNYIKQNGNELKCQKCLDSCCTNSIGNKCGCWFPNGCQKLIRINCSSKCSKSGCFGTGTFECCHKECLGGCVGPFSKDCVACKNFRIYETGECVDSCPRIKLVDTESGDVIINPNGMYQYGITCVRSCPKNLFVLEELCVAKCVHGTYEDEEFVNNPITGEKGLRRVCKPCTKEKCPKRCSFRDIIMDYSNLYENKDSIKNCEVFDGNLIILQNRENEKALTENELEVLSTVRIINGHVRIQSDTLKSLNFLRNLEIIRAPTLIHSKYSLIIAGKSLKTLNLKKLKSVENGQVFISAESLCLAKTVDWEAISQHDTYINEKFNSSLSCNGYVCHSACKGCWSTGHDYCQFCKSYKLEDICIEDCEGNIINNRYTYVENKDNRICRYCHPECLGGCNGPTENDCFSCAHFKIITNSTQKCLKECPSTHYTNKVTNECLPCADSCYGCNGPEEIISENGCVDCNSAIVDNDNSYTILKCILKENCPDGFTPDVIKLKTHPLNSRVVCRKCHNECDGCVQSGALLERNCIKCKNFHSNTTNECVNNCSVYNEYLKIATNTCVACDQECKLGCKGSSIFECNECRGYKLAFKDVKQLVNSLKLKEKSEIKNYSGEEYEIERTILVNYELLIKNSISPQNDVVFCIKNCPKFMPYHTMELFCTSKDTNQSNNFFIIIIVITTFIVIFLLIAIFGIGMIMKRLDRKNLLIQNEKSFFDSKEIDSESDDGYDEEKLNMTNLNLLKDNELEKCYMLGHGAFGTVFVGFYKPNGDEKSKFRVAIKELNSFPSMNEEKIKELENEIINEAIVMASVKHKYCLQLSGLCIAESIKMVTQLIPYGSAVSFLQKYRIRVTEKNLLIWAQQIAEGMDYLESRNIVHRDLAARNILIKNLEHIKITDFGLAKILDTDEKAFYAKSNSLLPIKWLAIESIQNRIFTHKSDVWSYGVCLWEIFTFCAKPYAEIETINIISYLKRGVRLSQPQIAGIEVYAIMLKCWLEKPYSRPSFKELSNEFSKMCQDPKNYLSFKSETDSSNFVTINENTQNLIQNIQNDSFDSNVYDYDEDKNKLYKNSNNNSSISPDEGIDLNSFELTNDQAYKKNNTLSNYNQSLVVFKRNSRVDKETKTKKLDYDTNASNLKKNRSFLRKLFPLRPKRLNSNLSTTTASTYMSSVYSDESNQVTRQSDSLNYEEQQSLLTSSASHLPTRSNSSNQSSIYNYNGHFRDVINSNSDYLEPIMHNIKQNFEYFGEANQSQTPSIIVIDKDKKLITNIANNSPYYNDNLI